MSNHNNNELCSTQSVDKCFIRFVNLCNSSVDCIWINYRGHRIKYYTLAPKQFFDVNTYVSHPWIFRDTNSNHKMSIMSIDDDCQHNKKLHLITDDVFWPKCVPNVENRRQILCITRRPVISLKERCFEIMRQNIHNNDHINDLFIPKTIVDDYLYFCNRFRNSHSLH